MQLLDSRRLTGPNLLANEPLVIVELALDAGDTQAAAVAAYADELTRMRAALGWPSEGDFIVRPHRGGLVVGYRAPLDVLLPCAEVSEWAGQSAAERLAGRPALALEPKLTEVRALLAHERSPNLVAVAAEARRRGVPLLWDDETVSVGAGRWGVSWGRHEVPPPGEVPWERTRGVPVALVTGTNGKTTSARVLARVALEAGYTVGATSTDAIQIGGETLERGDWTGPAAARAALRDPRVELAVLETARGGILRRGLAVDHADVALITNVSEDHLGLYGIDDLDAMVQVKAVITRVVPRDGTVVLNAADPKLRELRASLARGNAPRVSLFADLEGLAARDAEAHDGAARALAEHRADDGRAYFTRHGALVRATGRAETALLGIDACPLTFDGAARFNVENLLGVAAAAGGLGLPDDALVRTLREFRATDNPNRGELYALGRVRVLVDFGHNPAAVRATLGLARSLVTLGAGRLLVATGSAGDRTDAEIADIAAAVVEAQPAHVYVRELHDYLRGRQPGEVPAMLERATRERGLPAEAFERADSEADALRRALARARPGDLVVLLIHVEREPVRAFLEAERAERV